MDGKSYCRYLDGHKIDTRISPVSLKNHAYRVGENQKYFADLIYYWLIVMSTEVVLILDRPKSAATYAVVCLLCSLDQIEAGLSA